MHINRRDFVFQSALAAAALTAPRLMAVPRLMAATPGVFRYVRYAVGDEAHIGELEGERIHELRGDLFGKHARTGKTVNLDAVKLLVPCEPSKVLGVAANYFGPEGQKPDFKVPQLFFKAPSALLEHEGTIVIPEGAEDVVYEGELAVVIGKKAKNISPAQVKDCIFGVTCGNDVSCRNWSDSDVQWWRAKASDTFACLGPCIAAGLDYDNLLIQTRVNGERKQHERTSKLVFDISAIVSHVSQSMTLMPGDVIYTGTPPGVDSIKSGDVIEIEIEGIGILKNTVG